MPDEVISTTVAPKSVRVQAKTYKFSELRRLEFPPENKIIGGGFMSRHSVTALFAPPKSYKSFATNTILVQLLTGDPLFGVSRFHSRHIEHVFPITPVKRVLLIEQEIGPEDAKERLMGIFNTLPLAQQAIMDEHLYVRSCDYDLRLDAANGINKIRSIVDEVRPDVLCLDPLAKFHTSDENSPSEMGKVMLELRRINQDFDTTSLLIHHSGKNEEGKTGLDLMRGASSIAADIDTGLCIHVINRPASILWAEVVHRRGKPIPPFKLKLNHDTLLMEFHGWTKSKETYQSEASLSQVLEITDKKQ